MTNEKSRAEKLSDAIKAAAPGPNREMLERLLKVEQEKAQSTAAAAPPFALDYASATAVYEARRAAAANTTTASVEQTQQADGNLVSIDAQAVYAARRAEGRGAS
jgi:hypothetical protein